MCVVKTWLLCTVNHNVGDMAVSRSRLTVPLSWASDPAVMVAVVPGRKPELTDEPGRSCSTGSHCKVRLSVFPGLARQVVIRAIRDGMSVTGLIKGFSIGNFFLSKKGQQFLNTYCTALLFQEQFLLFLGSVQCDAGYLCIYPCYLTRIAGCWLTI